MAVEEKSVVCDNDSVYLSIGNQVSKEILGATDDAIISIGSLSTNYYSFTFSVNVTSSKGSRDVYVKIPKEDMRGIQASILPISSSDKSMAEEEISSLKLLEKDWNSNDLGVYWVRLCGAIPEYNVIVTERIFANEAFLVFRNCDLWGRFGFTKNIKQLQYFMSNMGVALSRFHQKNSRKSTFFLADVLDKFEFYCEEITASTGSRLPNEIMALLGSLGDAQYETNEVATLKGIDIRNVLIDDDENLYFLDPGKIKNTSQEADLSRFIMTYRALYWGSKQLLLFRAPDYSVELAFLNGYFEEGEESSPELLSIYILKEQLKHWHIALDSLNRLNWYDKVKYWVAKIYVNPFYTKQISDQLQIIMELKNDRL